MTKANINRQWKRRKNQCGKRGKPPDI